MGKNLILVTVEGGTVASVSIDLNPVQFEVVVIDYDGEGHAIPQDGGTTAPAEVLRWGSPDRPDAQILEYFNQGEIKNEDQTL